MTRNRGLLLLDATATLAAGQPLPKRLVIFPWGERTTPKFGTLRANEKTVKALSVIQPAIRRDFIHGDFQHNSLPDSKTYRGEPVKLSARRARAVCVPGEGIVAEDIEWLPLAEEEKANYPEISPAVIADDDGTIIGVDSFAICRHGQVGPELSLPLSAETAAAIEQQTNQPEPKQPQTKEPPMDYKKLCCQMLGLDPDTATDADIEAAAKKFAEDEAAEKAAAEKAAAEKAKGGKQEEVKALAAEIGAQLKPLIERLDGLERGRITDQAISDGKIIPLHADELPLEKFRALVKDLPADQVPMEQRTPKHVKALAAMGFSAGVSGDQAAVEKIASSFGISKERLDQDAKTYGR